MAKKSTTTTAPALDGAGLPKGRKIVTLPSLSKAERSALAKKILAARKAGRNWDGPGGILEEFQLAGAPVGRKLLREAGGADLVRPSYERKPKAATAEPSKGRKRAAK